METGITEQQPQAQQEENQEEAQPEWFQDFVDQYEYDKPQRGEILKGIILDISDNSILLDVGLKRDAIVTSQDLDKVDPEIVNNLEVGDEVFVSVFRTPIGDDDLLVSLNRGIAYKNWVKAQEYMEDDELLELEIIDQNRGGLLVDFHNLRGFVPNSHIPSLRRGSSSQKANEIKAEMIGDILPVKVIEVNRKQRRLVLSARVAQKEQRVKRLKELEPGDIIKSRVVNVVDFGVFVDLDGVDGLVHKSEIAWDRVYDPSKYFSVGDDIEVKIVDIDVERERVSLSRKALLPNPWDQLEDKYDEGDLVEGRVVSVLDFGAFIELPEGLQGLVHVSEIGYANMGDPESVVQEGDNVLVRILNIEPDRERVSLSMRRVPVDDQLAWMMEEEEDEDQEAEAVEEADAEEGQAEGESGPESDQPAAEQQQEDAVEEAGSDDGPEAGAEQGQVEGESGPESDQPAAEQQPDEGEDGQDEDLEPDPDQPERADEEQHGEEAPESEQDQPSPEETAESDQDESQENAPGADEEADESDQEADGLEGE